MREKPFLLHYSGIMALVGAFAGSAANGAVHISNQSRSYAGAYGQVEAMRQQAQYANSTAASGPVANELPVRVADSNLADMIVRGDTGTDVGINDLDACARIYPEGEFEWARPTAGAHAGAAPTCVAVVEMRAVNAAPGGGDAVLARVRVAAGDTVTCNISQFPDASYLDAAANVTFPADNAPTVDDVVNVMNQEQKQNAGIKIAAGALAFGLAGNMAGKNEVGKDGLLGTNKEKLGSTAAGALTGAAIMAGNTYGGKMAGDIILSTGINAAAGGMIGNMSASGDSVLRIENCKLPDGHQSSCLWGVLSLGDAIPDGKTAFYNMSDQTTVVCSNPTDGAVYTDCKSERLTSIVLDAYQGKKGDLDEFHKQGYRDIPADKIFSLDGDKITAGATDGADKYTPIATAQTISKQVPVMLAGVSDKSFGLKKSDWAKIRANNNAKNIYGRTNQGAAYALNDQEKQNISLDNFIPMYLDAEDGGLIDLDNKARAKGTLIGTAAGGAMGAFTAYQGAQDDIQERWATATMEYKDSLQKTYCATGKRFLSYYNSTVAIPQMNDK